MVEGHNCQNGHDRLAVWNQIIYDIIEILDMVNPLVR